MTDSLASYAAPITTALDVHNAALAVAATEWRTVANAPADPNGSTCERYYGEVADADPCACGCEVPGVTRPRLVLVTA